MALFTTGRCFSLVGKYLNVALKHEISRRQIHRFVRPTLSEIVRRQKISEPIAPEKMKRSSYLEWNMNAEVYAFGKRLGEEFKIELLLEAFIHRSYLVKEGQKLQDVGIDNAIMSLDDNEKLAKTGQAIISKEIKRFLSASFPRLPQEGITAIHNYLIKDETLAHVSKNLGTLDIILSAEYPPEEYTLAKTLKAVVGALVESQSEPRANKFVRDFILTLLAERDINEIYVIDKPLEVLTEILARDGRDPPEPRLIGQSASGEILSCYTVGIYSSKELIGEGPGESVEIAVEMAAHDALHRLFFTASNSAPLRFDIDVPEKVTPNLNLSSWKSSAFV